MQQNVFPCVAARLSSFHPSCRHASFDNKYHLKAVTMDDSQPLDLTQWDYNDLDFRTPQLSGIDSRGVSLTDLSPSPSYQRPRLPLLQLDDWDPDDTYDESPPTCVLLNRVEAAVAQGKALQAHK
jgi:hypothetical protein